MNYYCSCVKWGLGKRGKSETDGVEPVCRRRGGRARGLRTSHQPESTSHNSGGTRSAVPSAKHRLSGDKEDHEAGKAQSLGCCFAFGRPTVPQNSTSGILSPLTALQNSSTTSNQCFSTKFFKTTLLTR